VTRHAKRTRPQGAALVFLHHAHIRLDSRRIGRADTLYRACLSLPHLALRRGVAIEPHGKLGMTQGAAAMSAEGATVYGRLS
jgi:hypothetical protein